jgi:hypothetical protein
MSSRALTLATVMLLIGCLAADQAQAQATNLEAGKSPSQIFAGTCNACHKSPHGLLKTVPAGSLPTFLRQHYTTSPEMAGVLASFLVSNGATDTRYVGTPPKGAQEAKPPSGPPSQLDRFGRPLRPASPAQEAAKPETKPDAKPETEQRQADKPDADVPAPQADPTRPGHNKRLARPGEAPEGAKPGTEGQVPVQAESDRGPDGRKLSAKQQRLSKRVKPGAEEPPKTEEPAVGEQPKSETAAKDEGKPSTDAKPESAKSETAKVEPARGGAEPAATRPDPVPPVTPAPASATAAFTSKPEPLVAPAEPASQPPPPTVTASTPPLPPVAPAGPPAPPISQ